MSKKVHSIKTTPHEFSPLQDLVEPICLDDIAIQMSVLVGDCSDVEVVHKEADRLLIKALNMVKPKLLREDTDAIDAMITDFNTLGKWYD